MLQWSPHEVSEWAATQDLAEYRKVFSKKVDGLSLLLLTSADLQDLGISVSLLLLLLRVFLRRKGVFCVRRVFFFSANRSLRLAQFYFITFSPVR